MSEVSLGRLAPVELRDVWVSEWDGFTPWLARPENISLLGDTIGLDLEVEAQEKEVGPFRADILCKDTATDTWVLIENQLERTDHVHLGQLLTYAAGLNTVTIVWIAKRFTDEHRAALDWLNKVTDPNISFFGLEVELWRIGQSPVAPKFNVVSKPNDWSNSVAGGAAAASAGLTETRQLQLEYWTAFRSFLQERESFLKPHKAQAASWLNLPIGRAGFWLCAVASSYSETSDQHELRAELVIMGPRSKEYLALLRADEVALQSALGPNIVWHSPVEKKTTKIYVRRAANLEDRTNWPEQHKWLADNLELMHKVLGPRVKGLQLPEGGEPEVSDA